MEKEPRAMCQACGGKMATHHICQPGAEPPSMSLCGDCVETNGSAFVQAFMKELKNAVCCYCGGKARSSAVFPAAGVGYEAGSRFVCQSCSTESNRLFMAKLNELGMNLENFADLMAGPDWQRILEDLDAHMRRWVIQRDN